MTEDDVYIFQMDAYSPETIPMARLAEYMMELAAMFGEKNSVHFEDLEAGSIKLLSRVEKEAAPKVRENLNNAMSVEGGEAATSFKKLNELLRKDNAEAALICNEKNILNFPGRKKIFPPKLGPFTQDVVKEGVLVRVGRKKKSIYATIEDVDGKPWEFQIAKELAKELARHLFGKPIRLKGHGRWYRDEDAEWKCENLKADEFQLLSTDNLAEVVGRIRSLPADTWKQGADPIAILKSLRDEEGGIH